MGLIRIQDYIIILYVPSGKMSRLIIAEIITYCPRHCGIYNDIACEAGTVVVYCSQTAFLVRYKMSIHIKHLGQAGFVISDGVNVVVTDPYLSYSVDDGDTWIRKYAPPIRAEELTGAGLVLLSHDHLDHVDPETLTRLCAASPTCRFAASAAFAVERLTEIGIPRERIIPLECDTPLTFSDGLTVTPIPAAHEELHPCDEGGYAELGFIIDMDGRRIYHGGDTCVYDGLCDRICGVDIAMLPVNGRDERRHAMNCIGNMNITEAARLAHDAEIGCTVPCHWDLYEQNGETPENIRAAFSEYPELKYLLMCGNEAEF